MNVQRLQQLRRVVLEAPEDRWDMRTFYRKTECGTAHCMGGWCAIDPWFRENTEVREIFAVGKDEQIHFLKTYPTKKLGEVFGLNWEDSRTLFAVGAPFLANRFLITKAEVVANIDRILSGKPPEVYAAILAAQDEDDGEDD